MQGGEQDDLEIALDGLDRDGLLRHIERRGPELDAREVRRLLRHAFVDERVVAALAANRRATAGYAARRRIARHPRTAPTTALRFVPGLYWRDLVEVTVDVRIAPSVRRVAERYLLQRLPTLAVGERVAVARRAGSPVLAALRDDEEPRVIDAMLDNPRLTEGTLLPLAANVAAHPTILDRIARKGRWCGRYAIRAALARNPGTPLGRQLTLLERLRRADLVAIVRNPAHSSIVQRRAEELVAVRTPSRQA